MSWLNYTVCYVFSMVAFSWAETISVLIAEIAPHHQDKVPVRRHLCELGALIAAYLYLRILIVGRSRVITRRRAKKVQFRTRLPPL